MKIKFLFAWFDFWIGIFYDKSKKWVYILPLPTIGIILKLPVKRYWIYSKLINGIVGSIDKSGMKEESKQGQGKYKYIPYWAVNGGGAPLFGKDITFYIDD
jgi:hypothetical protein